MVLKAAGAEKPTVVYTFGGGKVRFEQDPKTGQVRKQK